MEILNHLYFMICCNLKAFVQDEEGAVDVVAVVVLIGIAVVLAILFREQIERLLTTLLATIQGNATDAVAN